MDEDGINVEIPSPLGSINYQEEEKEILAYTRVQSQRKFF